MKFDVTVNFEWIDAGEAAALQRLSDARNATERFRDERALLALQPFLGETVPEAALGQVRELRLGLLRARNRADNPPGRRDVDAYHRLHECYEWVAALEALMERKRDAS